MLVDQQGSIHANFDMDAVAVPVALSRIRFGAPVGTDETQGERFMLRTECFSDAIPEDLKQRSVRAHHCKVHPAVTIEVQRTHSSSIRRRVESGEPRQVLELNTTAIPEQVIPLLSAEGVATMQQAPGISGLQRFGAIRLLPSSTRDRAPPIASGVC